MRTINLGTADQLPPLDWDTIDTTLAEGAPPAPDGVNARSTWLTTVDADGRPHVTAVGAIWFDGAFWFQTGPSTRKARNVARDPRCTVAVSIRDADVVVEGTAARVTDGGELTRAAAEWVRGGWPAEVHPDGTGITAPFNAPGQGPAPWNVYRVTPSSVTAVGCVEPGGLTRFVF